MKTIFKTLSVALVIVALSSCEITKPVAATSNPIGSKVGTSRAFGILLFPPFIGAGNSGMEKAARSVGITKISTVDYTQHYYILWRTWTCTVTGE